MAASHCISRSHLSLLDDFTSENLETLKEMEAFLPLRIISIPGKGKGVVTLKNIPNNTLICWYIGDIQSIDDTDAENCDSLVDIGEV